MLSKFAVYADRYDERAFQGIKARAQKIQELEKKGVEKLKSFPPLLQDLYSVLYKADPWLKRPEEIWPSERVNRMLVEKVMDTKQYPELREYTYLDEFASSMGVLTLGPAALELIPEEAKQQLNRMREQEEKELQPLQNQAQQAQDQADDAQGEADDLVLQAAMAQNAAQKGQGQPSEAQNLQREAQGAQTQADKLQAQAQKVQMTFEEAQARLAAQAEALEAKLEKQMGEKLRQAVRKAVKDTLKEVEETSELLDAWGVEPGEIQNLPFEEKMELAKKIKDNKKLKDVAKLAGRFRRMALAKQKEKTQARAGAVTRIKRGNDLSRMHSSEALKLAHPYFRNDFLSRWAGRKLLVYETKKKDTLGEGPVIICIDNSGSIKPEQEVWEKALALGLFQAADYKKRHFVFIQYGGPSDPLALVEIRPREASYKKLIEVAQYFLGGGTDFEKPLKKAREFIEKGMKADIVFITDGQCAVSNDFLMSFNAGRKEVPFSVFSVLLTKGGDTSTATVEKFSNEVFTVEELTVDSAAEIFAAV